MAGTGGKVVLGGIALLGAAYLGYRMIPAIAAPDVEGRFHCVCSGMVMVPEKDIEIVDRGDHVEFRKYGTPGSPKGWPMKKTKAGEYRAEAMGNVLVLEVVDHDHVKTHQSGSMPSECECTRM